MQWGLRFACSLLAVGIALVAAASSLAAPAGGLRLLGTSGQETVPLEPQTSPLGLVGRITLVVLNESQRAGRLDISFRTAGGDRIGLGVLTGDSFSGTQPFLYSTDPALAQGVRIQPNRYRVLPLRIGLAKHASAAAANGVIMVRLADRPRIRPALVRIQGSIAPAAKEATLPVQPAKATVVVTRWWPLGIADDRRRVTGPRIWVPGGETHASTLTSSETGRDVRVDLVPETAAGDPPSGLTQHRLNVGDVPTAGKYEGELLLKAGGSDKVAVTVKVQDLFVWPFLAVLLGVAVGGLGTRLWEGHRRRELLRAALKRMTDQYDAARQEGSTVHELTDVQGRVADLRRQISGIHSDEDHTRVAGAVFALIDEVGVWLRTHRAVRELERLTPQLPDDHELREDVFRLLLDVAVPPENAEKAAELANRAERLRLLVRDALRPSVRVEFETFAFATEAAEPLYAEPEPEIERRSPEEIERIVRRWDWLVALGTAAVTLVLFTIGLYKDHTFGTYADYVNAFAVGFLGQLVVPVAWQLFPMFRSYVAARPKKEG